MFGIQKNSPLLRMTLVGGLWTVGCAPSLDVCSLSEECDGESEAEAEAEGEEECEHGTFRAESGACVEATSCTDQQYEVKPPTNDTDRVCQSLTHCEPGSYVLDDPAFDRDRVCATCPDGSTSSTYDAAKCDPIASLTCDSGKFESGGSCHEASSCDDDEFEFFPATSTTDTVCRPLTDCQPGEAVAYLPGDTRDRVCKPCDPETYSADINAPNCVPWTSCNDDPELGPPQFQALAPTSTSDRVCVDSFCGDGVTDPRRGEACDDGSDDDTGWCLEHCTIGTGDNLPPCDSNADCEIGECYQTYLDEDNDFYPGTISKKFCMTASHPGYFTEKTDCCDSDARAHIGQARFFSEPTACGGFDFDCDEEETAGYPKKSECIEAGDARLTVPGWTQVVPACGMSANYALLDDTEEACGAVVETRTQVCR